MTWAETSVLTTRYPSLNKLALCFLQHAIAFSMRARRNFGLLYSVQKHAIKLKSHLITITTAVSRVRPTNLDRCLYLHLFGCCAGEQQTQGRSVIMLITERIERSHMTAAIYQILSRVQVKWSSF